MDVGVFLLRRMNEHVRTNRSRGGKMNSSFFSVSLHLHSLCAAPTFHVSPLTIIFARFLSLSSILRLWVWLRRPFSIRPFVHCQNRGRVRLGWEWSRVSTGNNWDWGKKKQKKRRLLPAARLTLINVRPRRPRLWFFNRKKEIFNGLHWEAWRKAAPLRFTLLHLCLRV